MSNTIKLKRGTSTPSTSDISNGEVAIDTSAKKLYINDSGTVKEIGGSGTIAGASGLDFNDNVKVRFGTGNDLEIYHDGSNSFVSDTGTGGLKVLGSDIYLKNPADADMIRASSGGAVELYYDGAIKLTTEGTAVKVFGLFVPSTNDSYHLGIDSLRWQNLYISNDIDILDNGKLLLGAGDDLQIYHDGTHSRIVDHGSNATSFQTGELRIHDLAANEYIAKFVANGAVELYYDNVKKFETTSAGVTIDGDATFTGVNYNIFWDKSANALKFTDNSKAIFGDHSGTGDLHIYHDGTDSFVKEATGDLWLQSTADDIIIRAADNIVLQPQAGENGINVSGNGSVELYYDNSKKIQTASYGLDILDDVVFDNGINAGKDINWIEASNKMRWQDDVKATFGAGDDLQIYHDGTVSRVQDDTNPLYIKGSDIYLYKGGGAEKFIHCHGDAQVELYYDGVKQFETLSNGVRLKNGHLHLNEADSMKILLGASDDLQIYHDGSHSYIDEAGTGGIKIRTAGEADVGFYKYTSNEKLAEFQPDNSCRLYYDNSKKFETTSAGATVTGSFGIGTTSPAALLHISHSGTSTGTGTNICASLRSGASGRDQCIQFADSATSAYLGMIGGDIYIADSSSTEKIRFKSDGTVKVVDNAKFIAGAGDDLQIYHDGSNSTLSNTTGYFHVSNTNGIIYLDGNNTYIRNGAASEYQARFMANGAVELYYDNAKKFNTASTGCAVTGILWADTVKLEDNGEARFGTGNDLKIYHDGSDSYINNTTGDMWYRTYGPMYFLNSWDSEYYAKFKPNNTVELYYDGSKKFETTSTGIIITGSDVSGSANLGSLYFKNAAGTVKGHFDTNNSRFRLYDNFKLTAGSGDDLQIYHDGGNSIVDSHTGDFYIRNRASSGQLVFEPKLGEAGLVIVGDGAVELRYDNSKKLETFANGIKLYDTQGDLIGEGFDGGFNFTSSVMVNELRLQDNEKIKVGLGEDLQIYHDGSNSYINNTTGILRIRDSEIRLCNTDNETYFMGAANGAAKLYYDDAVKLETTSTGIDVTNQIYFNGDTDTHISNGGNTANWIRFTTGGNVVMDITDTHHLNLHDDRALRLGNSNDLQIWHASSSSTNYFYSPGTNNIEHSFNVASSWTLATTGADKRIHCPGSGTATSVELYHNGSKKLETTSTGINVTGGIRLGGNNAANECDDYEEGTWTPALSFNADTGITYDTAGADATGGTYTKIGRQVTVHGHIHLTSKGSSTGSAKIHGLPFTSNGDDNNRGSGSVGYVNQMNLDGPILILEERSGQTWFYLRALNANFDGSYNLTSSSFNNTARFFFSYTYNT